MNIKSINLIVNNYCNNKCNMCNIWNNKRIDLPVSEIKKLFSHQEFKYVEDISISGGEPFMRKDISQIIEEIIPASHELKMLFLNTSGVYPKRTIDTVKKHHNNVKELYVSVSIEGIEQTHNLIRGIKSHKLAINTLKEIKNLDYTNVKTIISTTIQDINGDATNLDYLIKLAEETKSEFSFRFADKSETYYNNLEYNIKIPSKLKKLSLIDSRIQKLGSNVFFDVLKKYIATDTIPLMQDSESKEIKCKAGELFCFVNYNGKIYPCLYSTRIIGNTSKGITEIITDLGSKEKCPCATDCHIYPMSIYSPGKKNDHD